ncbi:MAG: glycosyltransferase family 2 protein [Rhodoblastus sp.]
MTLHPDLARIDGRSTATSPNDILAVMTVRNERVRLPWLFAYYRKLGVDRFFVIDNDSTDGTTEWLLSQDDTHTFFTRESYRNAQHGTQWHNSVLGSFALDRWCLTVDADEVLVYPLSEQIDLRALCGLLSDWSAEAMFALMLDCYGQGRVHESRYEEGSPFWDANPYFDRGPYFVAATPGHTPSFSVRGGVRHRSFAWDAKLGGAPVIRKAPLVKVREGDAYLNSTHRINRKPLAPISGALLHFKFLGDFQTRIEEDVSRKDRPDTGRHYDIYAGALAGEVDKTLISAASHRYSDSLQLVSLGLCGLPRKAAAALFEQAKGSLSVSQRNVLWSRIKEVMAAQREQFRPELGHLLQLFAETDPSDGGFTL